MIKNAPKRYPVAYNAYSIIEVQMRVVGTIAPP
jgi:hypothetical protein